MTLRRPGRSAEVATASASTYRTQATPARIIPNFRRQGAADRTSSSRWLFSVTTPMAPTSIPKLVGQRALLGAVSKVRSEPEQVMRPQAPICRTLSILQRPNSTGPFRRPLPSYLPSDSRFQTQAATSRPFATVTPSSSPMSNSSVISADADAVILGGGVVGLALAASLVTSPRIAGKGGGSDDPLRVVVLEASDLSRLKDWAATQEQTQTHSSAADRTLWENRVVSITLENWLWLEGECILFLE